MKCAHTAATVRGGDSGRHARARRFAGDSASRTGARMSAPAAGCLGIRRCERARRRAGMTLIELIMVMLVIGLIFGLTLPLAGGLAARFKVRGVRDVFASYHARARAGAVQFGRQGRLHIDAASRRFWVEVDTGLTGAVGTDTLGILMDVTRDFNGVLISSDRGVLCFDSRGLPFASGVCEPADATVVFHHQDGADTVRISLGGTILER